MLSYLDNFYPKYPISPRLVPNITIAHSHPMSRPAGRYVKLCSARLSGFTLTDKTQIQPHSTTLQKFPYHPMDYWRMAYPCAL